MNYNIRINKILDRKGQIILYGVPGTGKTHLALKYVKERTDESKYKFITFHQSYSYEDFIEGFRPKTDDKGNIIYEVEDGIFKEMCILAIWEVLKNKEKTKEIINLEKLRELIVKFKNWLESEEGKEVYKKRGEKTKKLKEYINNLKNIKKEDFVNFYKSLWASNPMPGRFNKISNEKFKEIKEKLIKSLSQDTPDEERFNLLNEIDGFGIATVTEILTKKFPEKYAIYDKKRVRQFLKEFGITIKDIKNYGDYKDFIKSLKPIKDELSKILGKNVNFLDVDFFIYWYIEYYNKNLLKNKRSYEEIKKIVIEKLKEHQKSKDVFKKEDFEKAPKYYLIIDEINRGNISNILGELITLLEKDKRLGEDNEIIITLPYSKEPFAVPPNLYIIGTMNTADRSIALLDIALRRRFGFLEVEPDYNILKSKNIEEINLGKLLESLNKKIVKQLDKDHRIGHSYFLKVENIEDLEFVWYHEIIPLLEEHFYGDFEGLKDIIGDFIDTENYEIKKLEGEEFIRALRKIIEEKNE